MTTTDYPDWTQPVALNEQISANIVPGGSIDVDGNAGPFDTSGASSMVVGIEPPVGVAGDNYNLCVQWQESNQIVDLESVAFFAGASYSVGAVNFAMQIPVRATSVLFFLFGSGAGPVAVQAYLSTRTIPSPTLRPLTTYRGRLIASQGTISIPASSVSGPYYVPPALATVLAFNQNSGKVINIVSGLAFTTNPAGSLQPVGTFQSTPSAQTPNIGPVELALPGVGLSVIASNQDSAAHNWAFSAWDAG